MNKSNRFLFVVIIFGLCFACTQGDHSFDKSQYSQTSRHAEVVVPAIDSKYVDAEFLPDTSVCNFILESHSSIESGYGDIMGDSANVEKGYETFYFSTIDTSEYLKLIFFPGNTRNAFSRFVVSEFDTRPKNRKLYCSQCPAFVTENQIKLGITLAELEKIKGVEYLQTKEGDLDVYTYSYTVAPESEFYRRYRMPVYSEVYRFYDGKLVEFEFGFEYP